MRAYRVKGTTDEVTDCELCGKPELKGTVVLATLDADGNEDGGLCYFGSSCAAKAASWTLKEVRAGIKAAQDAERAREQAARTARESKRRAFLASWYLEHYGTEDLYEAAKRAGLSTVRLSGVAIRACNEMERAGEAVNESPAEEPTEVVDAVPAPAVDFRETTITVAGVAHVVRTERTGTVKQLEAAHTQAVKAAIIDARRANLPAFIAAAESAALKSKQSPGSWFLKEAAKDARNIVRRAERGTFHSHTSPWAADLKPFPKVRFTDAVPAYLTEIEPGHYATEEAAEQLKMV